MAEKNEELYNVVDYILNKARGDELEVIREALKRREQESKSPLAEGAKPGDVNLNPNAMAKQMSDSIQNQIGGSVEQIRSIVRNYARNILKQNAPELGEKQIDQLLTEWIPGDEKTGTSKEAHTGLGMPASKGENSKNKEALPEDALLTMIDQFIRYSTGQMSLSEQNKLRNEIPDWHKKYWDAFPEGIQALIAKYLKEGLDADSFWKGVAQELS